MINRRGFFGLLLSAVNTHAFLQAQVLGIPPPPPLPEKLPFRVWTLDKYGSLYSSKPTDQVVLMTAVDATAARRAGKYPRLCFDPKWKPVPKPPSTPTGFRTI